MTTTWDGLEAADEPPFGAQIIVYRGEGKLLEILLLHRAHHGPDFEGDWAWTPPSGCRFPGEAIAACAERELQEEAGLRLPMEQTDFGSAEWPLYMAAMDDRKTVYLIDPEHDKYAWMPASQAIERCEPAIVKEPLRRAVQLLRKRSLQK
ncbi:MAG TPA: NUDIX domain-containing protein [Candidatus Saccharimonadales bacterium]|jgi:8-oxo-dGTP pyrophosphatase MutT (NUDIX family)|nr:NUDIX domain-containing protein [Candidatus Saccharimonadales bacterium]